MTAPTGTLPALALLADPACKQHDPGFGHPEAGARFDAVMEALERADILSRVQRLAGRSATEGELLLAHTPEYLALVRHDMARGAAELSTGDTALSAGSLAAAELSAGLAVMAVDAVCGGRSQRGLALGRPPGHHASSFVGMGFCIFNNVAIAARYAQQACGIGRVLVVDWDVHHGNGTQDIFYEDDSVFYFSTHQAPWYPGTGEASETGRGRGLGTTLNAPLPAGTRGAEVRDVFENRLLPAMARFKPELVLISAGFDSREHDPLGLFHITDADFSELTRLVMTVAEEHAEGRLVSVLEGGYNPEGLGLAVAAHTGALMET